MTTRVEISDKCPARTGQPHYKLMTYVAYVGTVERCEHCGKTIYVRGAKWVTIDFIIAEEEQIEDLLHLA